MVSNIFYFSPYLGKMTHFDEHIFQLGWNHQLVCFIFYFLVGVTLDFLNFVSVTLTRTRVVQKTSSHHYSGIHKPKVSAWFFKMWSANILTYILGLKFWRFWTWKTLEFSGPDVAKTTWAMKKGTWWFRVYRGWTPTQLYRDFNKPWRKDPHQKNNQEDSWISYPAGVFLSMAHLI